MISIVILTFNSRKLIKNCLDSIYTQDYPDIEVIIVDNGSKDSTVVFIKENYPRVILIENKENLGTCKARNQGIKMSKGEWILTLDCDTILKNNFISIILEIINDLPLNIGILQPRILNSDGKTIYSCGIFLSWLRKFYDIGKDEYDNEKFNRSQFIFGACSAAAVYRRKMLQETREPTGYFDERFFFLVEDVDLSYRAQSKGYKALYYPEAHCYHYGNSSGTNKLMRQYLSWKNRRLLLKKCKINRLKLAVISLYYDFPRSTFLFLSNPYVHNEIKNSISNLWRDF